MYPRVHIYVSMLLPTKLNSLNYIVNDYNSLLVAMVYNHRNIHLIEHSELIGDRGYLKDEFGRFSGSQPNSMDFIHLGKKGIRVFANEIKSCILKRRPHSKGKNVSQAAVGSPDKHHRDGYQPPNRNGV